MAEKRIRHGMCPAICKHAEGNSKYMIDYDPNKKSSYLTYCNVSTLYRWTMLQKLLVNNF